MRQVLRQIVRDAVAELHLVDRPVRAALAARAVVGDDHDHRVLELLGVLEVVQQAADVVVGVREEPGVHLGHVSEQPLLIVVQRVPRPRVVDLGERLAVGTLVRVSAVPIGLTGGSSVSAGTRPSSF